MSNPNLTKELYSPKHLFLVNNLRAISIMGVAIGHLSSYASTPIIKVIMLMLLPISMPIFSFGSGFHHSKEVFSNKASFSIERTIALFFAGFLILAPERGLIYYFTNGLDLGILYKVLVPSVDNFSLLWYIVAVVIWRLCAPVIVKVKYYMILVLALGVSSAFMGDEWYRGLFRYMPFYFLGLNLSWANIIKMRISKTKYIAPICLILSAGLAFLLSVVCKIPLSPGNFNETGIFNYILVTLVYYLISGSIIFTLFGFFPGRKFKLFTQVGTNCMSVYFLHLYFVVLMAKYAIYPLMDCIGVNFVTGAIMQILILAFTFYVTSLNIFAIYIGKLTNFFYRIIFKQQSA